MADKQDTPQSPQKPSTDEAERNLSILRERVRPELREWGMSQTEIDGLGSASEINSLLARKQAGDPWPLPAPTASEIEALLEKDALYKHLEEERRRKAEISQAIARRDRSIYSSIRFGSFQYASKISYEVARARASGGTMEDAIAALHDYDPPESVARSAAPSKAHGRRFRTSSRPSIPLTSPALSLRPGAGSRT